MKIVLCMPTYLKPHPATLAAIEASVPVLDARGIGHQMISKYHCPYISHAMAGMLRQAMDTDADAFVFIDSDVSWEAGDLADLVECAGDVVAGTYRFKKPEVEYMGTWFCHPDGRPQVRPADGAIRAEWVPSGFLKVTRKAVRQFMKAYPDLLYGEPEHPSVDLFNHGAHKWLWWGQDYAFCRRWRECGGEVWLVPDLSISHHEGDQVYPGNLHQWLLRLPGGSEHRQAA
jgi:hypothetical protein